MSDAFIAVDWGTSNRRAYAIEGHDAACLEVSPGGIVTMPRDCLAHEVAAIRGRFGGRPMLLAGMIGSTRGWIDAGYVECPATLEKLADRVAVAAPEIRIVPGVSYIANGRSDVMRGEEVLVLGAVHAGLVPPDALICQPGTHCKWVRMRAGAIAGFTTAMTGELFGLLNRHALIGEALAAPVVVGEAFAQGVDRAAEGDLLAALFGVRAASLLGLRDDRDAASYVSGLLIGSDVLAQIDPGEQIFVLSDPSLGAFYRAAIEQLGARAISVDSEVAFAAGMKRLWELLP